MDRSTRRSVVHKIYKNATSLHAYLSRADHYAEDACGCCLPTDCAAYQKLLHQTIVVGELETFPDEASQNATSMKDVLESALPIANRSNCDGKRTLLLLGYRQKRYSSDHGMRNMLDMENTHVNTSLSVLKTPEWEALLQRIGNARMLHLLLNTSLFLASENGCYVQITGTPVSEVNAQNRSLESGSLRSKKRPRTEPTASQGVGPFAGSTKLSRGGMLYRDAHVRRLGMPRSHILSSSTAQPDEVFDKIWNKVTFPPKSEATTHELRQLLNNHRRIDLGRLLHTYLPLPTSNQHASTPVTAATAATAEPHTTASNHSFVIDDSVLMTQAEATDDEPVDSGLWPVCDTPLDTQSFPPTIATNNEPKARRPAKLTTAQRRQNRAANLKQLVGEAEDFRTLAFSSTQVANFVKAYIRRLLPAPLMGSRHNMNVLMAGVHQFITLQRHDSITLGKLRAGIRTSDMKWLQQASRKWKVSGPAMLSQASDQTLFALLRWLFGDVILALVESLFYVTEAEGMFQQLLYYRRPVWRALRNQAPTSSSQFVPCTETECLSHEKSALPNVRFVPKQNKLRAITNLSKKEGVEGNGSGSSTVSNLTLNSAFQVLKSVCAERPGVFGFGAFGMDDIYRMLRAYKERHQDHDDTPFYIASLDIEQCYDMIQQQRLFELVHELLPDEKEFLLHKYGVVYPISSLSRLQIKYLRRVTSGEYTPFEDAASHIASQYRNSIVFDGVQYVTTSKAKIMKLIEDHLFRHVVNFPTQWSRQSVRQVHGVPQGSILSPLFCNIYYGAVEHELFDGEYNALGLVHDSFIIRLMDDYIMVSTKPEAVKRFLEIAHNKLHQYGGRVNPEKTQVNFDVSITWEGKEVQLPRVSANGNFQWCGINICQATLDATPDFSRFFRQPISSTVSRELGANPGWHIRQRMKSFMRPKCHAVLLDTSSNDIQTVTRNVYELFLVTAMRTHSYLATIGKRAVHNNWAYLLRCVMELISYTTRLVHIRTSRKQLRSWLADSTSANATNPLQVFRDNRRHTFLHEAFSTTPSLSCLARSTSGTHKGKFGQCSLTPHEIVRLGLTAFHEVFSHHKALYGRLNLKVLQQQVFANYQMPETQPAEIDLSTSNKLLQSINWK